MFGFWLAKDFAEKKASTKTQSMVMLGGPINITHMPDGNLVTGKTGEVPNSDSVKTRSAYVELP